MGPNGQNQYFAELRQKVCLYSVGSAPKRFAKFGRQKRTFCGKKREKRLANSSQTDYSGFSGALMIGWVENGFYGDPVQHYCPSLCNDNKGLLVHNIHGVISLDS